MCKVCANTFRTKPHTSDRTRFFTTPSHKVVQGSRSAHTDSAQRCPSMQQKHCKNMYFYNSGDQKHRENTVFSSIVERSHQTKYVFFIDWGSAGKDFAQGPRTRLAQRPRTSTSHKAFAQTFAQRGSHKLAQSWHKEFTLDEIQESFLGSAIVAHMWRQCLPWRCRLHEMLPQ